MPRPLRKRLLWWRVKSCARVAPLLQHYLDGEVDAGTARVIEWHLEDCRRCGLELEDYVEVRRSLRLHLRPDDEVLERLRRFCENLAAGAADQR